MSPISPRNAGERFLGVFQPSVLHGWRGLRQGCALLHRKVRRFLVLPPQEQALFLEALGELIRADFEVKLMPDTWVTAQLGRSIPWSEPWCQDSDPVLTERERLDGLRIKRAVLRGERHLPGAMTCLMKALAGRRMLRRRGLDARVFLGVKKDASGQGLDAHAWLTLGTETLLGGDQAFGFTVVACFS